MSDFQSNLPLPAYADAYSYLPGQIPVILTVPHGISLDESTCTHLTERQNGLKVEELHVLQLTNLLVEGLRHLWAVPHVLIARVHRSRIDFARSQTVLRNECAYDDPRAEPYYLAFEDHLTTLCHQLTQSHPNVLLLDVHGCIREDYDAFLGTLNGQTSTTKDGQFFGRDALQRALTSRRWRVAPSPGAREVRFSGRSDSIIARHNLALLPGTNTSIQIEISGAIRRSELRRQQFASDLASAIVSLFTHASKIHVPME